ncbi:PKD domain-containing protein [Halomicroarcula sp. F28]|uniref:PKD domain-containing protein n=1 Tax=Haloarcula salinisoli TaxID=2487746 RepID=UPI001C72D90A|nr:PKD domain-containing protein [Halomicroarcula salinisoli]MBX0286389.1 PKD domain-containing protein [Halomicroarcula salinisoli]
MRVGALLLLAAVLLFSTSGIAAAADNTAPMPEAGVDQTVPVNSTVYLDGTASTDPDGEIVNVAWTIETPSGKTMSPDCGDCNRTQFEATAVGQYTVTLTVTDDDGATRSDTLYVTTTNESGPDVSISGPTSTVSGSDVTFTANVSAEQASLQTLTWLVNGSVVQRDSLNGSSATSSFTHSFDETAPVRAVVYDTLGNRGSATHRVSVGSVGGGGSGSYQCLLTSCGGTGADSRWTEGDVTVITDTNDKEGLQTYNDEGDLVTIKNPDENDKIDRGPNGEYRIEGGLSSLDDDAFKSDDDESQDSSGSGSPTSDVSSGTPSSIFYGGLDSLPFSGGGRSTDGDNVDSINDGGGFIGGGLRGL